MPKGDVLRRIDQRPAGASAGALVGGAYVPTSGGAGITGLQDADGNVVQADALGRAQLLGHGGIAIASGGGNIMDWSLDDGVPRTNVGGRLVIGKVLTLAHAMTANDLTIAVTENQLKVNELLFLQRGMVITEYVRVTSAGAWDAQIGGYVSSVTRDLAGTTAQGWYAGETVVDLGLAGSGFVEIYGQEGLHSGEYGPALVANLRNASAVYNGWDEIAAVGNLQGKYDYAAPIFGGAFGEYGGAWLAADNANGLRIMNQATRMFQVRLDGSAVFGAENIAEIEVSPAQQQMLFKVGGVTTAALDANSRSIYGFERLGRPHGPCIEWGPVDDDSGSLALQRFGLWVRAKDNKAFAMLVSGTQSDPDKAFVRFGKLDADQFWQLRDGKLSWSAGNTSLSEAGAFTSTSGQIGGWTIASSYLSGGAARLYASGYLQLGTSDNVITLNASDPTWRIAVGHNTMGSAPFRVDKAGNVYALSVKLLNASGSSSGVIGYFENSGAGEALQVQGTTIAAANTSAATIDVSNVHATGKGIETTCVGTGVSGTGAVCGVYGGSSALGVHGYAALSSGIGVQAECVSGGTALKLVGGPLNANSQNINAVNDLEIDGALNHDGSSVGFFGTAPASRPSAYTFSNGSSDRSIDCDSTTLEELADVVYTLWNDLKTLGLLQ